MVGVGGGGGGEVCSLDVCGPKSVSCRPRASSPSPSPFLTPCTPNLSPLYPFTPLSPLLVSYPTPSFPLVHALSPLFNPLHTPSSSPLAHHSSLSLSSPSFTRFNPSHLPSDSLLPPFYILTIPCHPLPLPSSSPPSLFIIGFVIHMFVCHTSQRHLDFKLKITPRAVCHSSNAI